MVSKLHKAHEAQMDAMVAEGEARMNGKSPAEIRRLERASIEAARKYNEVEARSKRR